MLDHRVAEIRVVCGSSSMHNMKLIGTLMVFVKQSVEWSIASEFICDLDLLIICFDGQVSTVLCMLASASSSDI